jgi:hypothetical protein
VVPAVPPPPGDYTHRWSAHVNPRVLQVLVVLAMLGVVVLSFFPWVGRYPGGLPVVTQSAWQAAFGSETVDTELKKMLPELRLGPATKTDEPVGSSGMLILFVLLLIPTLLVTVAAAFWDALPAAVRARIQGLKSWRWGLAVLLLLLTFVLLVVQQVSGFNLETRTTADVDRAVEDLQKAATASEAKSVDVKRAAVERGVRLHQLQRTAALSWATWLEALALICALLVVWVERRANRPLPRLDVLW